MVFMQVIGLTTTPQSYLCPEPWIINLAYGFHSAGAALALIMVTFGPINHVLPHERGPDP